MQDITLSSRGADGKHTVALLALIAGGVPAGLPTVVSRLAF